MEIKELTVEEQNQIDGGGIWDQMRYWGRAYVRQKKRELKAGVTGAAAGFLGGPMGALKGFGGGVIGAKVDGLYRAFKNRKKHMRNAIRAQRKR